MMKGFLLLDSLSTERVGGTIGLSYPMENVVRMAKAQASKLFGWSEPKVLDVVHSRYGYLVVVSDDLPEMVGTGSKTAIGSAVNKRKQTI